MALIELFFTLGINCFVTLRTCVSFENISSPGRNFLINNVFNVYVKVVFCSF